MKYTAVSAPSTSAAAAAARTKPSLRGVSHQLAALASVATGSYLVCLAASRGRPALVGSVVYSLSVLALFTMSAVYHRVTWNPNERAILRRMDHAAIFVLIAGTYTPIVLLTFEDEGYARKFLLVIWLLATLGIGISVFWPKAPKALVALICVGFGSAGLLKWREFESGLTGNQIALIAVGGLAYTGGAVIYAMRKPDPWPLTFGYHEIFHALTIVAWVCHFAAIYELVVVVV